jgi:hypothetical protein
MPSGLSEQSGCWTNQGPMFRFLNFFRQKNLRFWAQNKAKLFKKLILTLDFEKNANF